MSPAEVTARTIYTEVPGTTVHLDGNTRGTVTAFTYIHQRVKGAFVHLDRDDNRMVHVTLGHQIGDRGQRHEIESWRVIDRDEFDRLSGVAAIRRELGWKE